MGFVAAILGIVGGLVGLTTGLGLTSITAGPTTLAFSFADLDAVRFGSVVVPLASLIGGLSVKHYPLIGGVLMVISGAGMSMLFEIDPAMQLAVAATSLGSMMAILAGSHQPVLVPAE